MKLRKVLVIEHDLQNVLIDYKPHGGISYKGLYPDYFHKWMKYEGQCLSAITELESGEIKTASPSSLIFTNEVKKL